MSDQQQISQEVLNNMGSLDGYLDGRGYTNGVVAMQGETIVRDERGVGPVAAPEQQVYAPDGVVPRGDSGLAPQPALPAQPVQPAISQEQFDAAMLHAQQMRQIAFEANRQRLMAEEQAFVDAVNRDPYLNDEQKYIKLLERQNGQFQQANEAQQNEIRRREQLEYQSDQEKSKFEVAAVLATNSGLNFWGDANLRKQILRAETKTDMDEIISSYAAYAPRTAQSPQQTPAQVAGGLVAAPARGANSGNGRPHVKKGSGDLGGLLKERGYQTVAVQ